MEQNSNIPIEPEKTINYCWKYKFIMYYILSNLRLEYFFCTCYSFTYHRILYLFWTVKQYKFCFGVKWRLIQVLYNLSRIYYMLHFHFTFPLILWRNEGCIYENEIWYGKGKGLMDIFQTLFFFFYDSLIFLENWGTKSNVQTRYFQIFQIFRNILKH